MNNYDISAIKTLVVHAGILHADDVFTAAFIQAAKAASGQAPVRIIRTFKVQEFMTLENGYIVADIGKTEFDHHFPEDQKERRANGVPYAAFGLVAKAFYSSFLSKAEYETLDKRFIMYLDEADNNGTQNTLSACISAFNRNWDDEDPNSDPCFFEALSVASVLLDKQIESVKSLCKAREIADNSVIESDHTIYLDKYAPIAEFFSADHDAWFVGSPSLRGGYQIISIKDTYGNNKRLFPKECRGYNPGPGIYDTAYRMNFCHPSGFMATFKTKEDAKTFMVLEQLNFERP